MNRPPIVHRWFGATALRSGREQQVLTFQLGRLAQHGGAVLVGQQPNAACARHPEGWLLPDEASGTFHTANRLLAYSGLTLAEYLRVFPVRSNACVDAVTYDARLARERVRQLALGAVQAQRTAGRKLLVVLLGRKAWDAARGIYGTRQQWDSEFPPYFWLEDSRAPSTRLAYVPHTSGQTRAYNTPEQRAACRTFLQALRDEVLTHG
jgi:hypothetical protein